MLAILVLAILVFIGLEAVIVGMTLFVLCGHRLPQQFSAKLFFLFAAPYVVNDTCWYLVAMYLDVTVVVDNIQVANLLGLHGPLKLTRLVGPGWSDTIVWSAQSVIGYGIGRLAYKRMKRKMDHQLGERTGE